jgi:hypothetical protein
MSEAYKRRERHRINELLYMAWHTALFERQKKLPALNTVLLDEQQKEHRKQTVDEMIAVVKLLNAAYGGIEVEV